MLGLHQLISGLIIYVFTRAMSDAGRDMTYDRLKQRYVRMRQEQIELLKVEDTPKEYALAVIDAIKVIDAHIEQSKDYHGLPGSIGNLFFTHGRKEMEMQKQLEKLASNDLFIHAATFKHAQ